MTNFYCNEHYFALCILKQFMNKLWSYSLYIHRSLGRGILRRHFNSNSFSLYFEFRQVLERVPLKGANKWRHSFMIYWWKQIMFQNPLTVHHIEWPFPSFPHQPVQLLSHILPFAVLFFKLCRLNNVNQT